MIVSGVKRKCKNCASYNLFKEPQFVEKNNQKYTDFTINNISDINAKTKAKCTDCNYIAEYPSIRLDILDHV